MFCLFVRFLPMVATAEVKTVLPQAHPHGLPGHEHQVKAHRGLPGRGELAPEGAS
jgi:hypothetical protein